VIRGCPACLQAFHTLYHTDESVLLGSPTGSGKTISAELAMLRVFREHPGMKIIYIAPLKVCVICLDHSFSIPGRALPSILTTTR
jgi:ERCC4-related helicase